MSMLMIIQLMMMSVILWMQMMSMMSIMMMSLMSINSMLSMMMISMMLMMSSMKKCRMYIMINFMIMVKARKIPWTHNTFFTTFKLTQTLNRILPNYCVNISAGIKTDQKQIPYINASI